jgi:rhomboid family GlyGly-CTERM serine protease
VSNATETPAPVALPWATALILVAAVVATASPAVGEAFEFERDKILAGQWWRLWSAHLAHFGWSHFAWNAAVFALTGAWAERIAPQTTRVLYVVAPPVIGVALLALDVELQRYAGLSGLAAGTLTLLALTQLAPPPAADRWFWRAVLGLLLAKIAFEVTARQPAFARFTSADIRPVPTAHVAGALAAAWLHFRGRRRRKRSGND